MPAQVKLPFQRSVCDVWTPVDLLQTKRVPAAAAAAYPDYVQLPPETPRGATGWWKGGYRSSAKTILRWWYPPATMVLIK